MKRLNPAGSILGFVLTTLLFVGLGFSVWHDRGLAFSPGPLSNKTRVGVVIKGFTSHSEFQKNCSYCHEPLKASIAEKCTDCHMSIQEQIQNGTGVHHQMENVNRCVDCHPEHMGVEFDPTSASFNKFDHSITSFSLDWHQLNFNSSPMQCVDCHKNRSYSVVENQTCQDCHDRANQEFITKHIASNGASCLLCHDGKDRMKDFDHLITGFPLNGMHASVYCLDCHEGDKFSDTPTDCQYCHKESSMHLGLFAETCNICHTVEGWTPAEINQQTFDHFANAGFTLALHQKDYLEKAITCNTCHMNNLQTFEAAVCFECHAAQDQPFMEKHVQDFNSTCLECHDGVDRLSDFNHDHFFPLTGKHAEAGCSECHLENTFRGTPKECSSCHNEPEIHLGVFGLGCDNCHVTSGWTPASLQKHSFPLNHGLDDSNLQLQCDVCHGQTYTEFTCYGCHDHLSEDILQSHLVVGIQAQEIPACETCHPDGSIVEGSQVP